jgi:hypothetical protein
MRRHLILQTMETKSVVLCPKVKNARKLSEIIQHLDNPLQACISVTEECM